jgi:3-deoxy-D-manno-octulosonate 8-phosphate phosphatase (KDO 8-P phosphatase)
MPARGGRGVPSTARLRRIGLLVLDVDGVLTDGRLYYGPGDDGEWKAFHVHDGLALARAAAAGYPVAVVSSRAAQTVARRMAELGIREVHQGVPDKLAVYEALRARYAVGAAAVACMGDDLPDLPVLRQVGLAVAPADAVAEVRRAAHWVTRAPGGRGAVREVVEALLRARGAWPT